ncbi:MAG: glycerophosphodiester phosphodiesterase, partial [Candidatus Competibacter sp.]|nr:glycerophosphodiester phosphodiesterase [Candidatus Competibacter sp.]
MKKTSILAVSLAIATTSFVALANTYFDDRNNAQQDDSIQLGPRPFYLVKGMDDGKLKDRLMQCQDGPFYRTDFSIGHRGAALQFPEHSDVAYRAGAR